ncbi:hypothetical protein [Corallococcus sp. AS-1-6]|uniref:hypothetical protein n=1 Tax=Corallococcus sp. AS-1-6 TaxID=2874599 RepID=UPI001CBC9B31|nr:hypothetical protein [Corallococcus sp. AS-1-6]MBZ4373816.1 hypothetical protein [Corallococcus sp. AS-1-6]
MTVTVLPLAASDSTVSPVVAFCFTWYFAPEDGSLYIFPSGTWAAAFASLASTASRGFGGASPFSGLRTAFRCGGGVKPNTFSSSAFRLVPSKAESSSFFVGLTLSMSFWL